MSDDGKLSKVIGRAWKHGFSGSDATTPTAFVVDSNKPSDWILFPGEAIRRQGIFARLDQSFDNHVQLRVLYPEFVNRRTFNWRNPDNPDPHHPSRVELGEWEYAEQSIIFMGTGNHSHEVLFIIVVLRPIASKLLFADLRADIIGQLASIALK
jgi:hypothetical protein